MKYVDVRGKTADIADEVTAAGTGVVNHVDFTPITCFGGEEVVEIVSFDDANEDKAVPFSLNRPEFDGTVFSLLRDAKRNAVVRAEGQ